MKVRTSERTLRARSTVPSVLPESTRMTSSAHSTDERHDGIFSTSLYVRMITDSGKRLDGSLACRPSGGLSTDPITELTYRERIRDEVLALSTSDRAVSSARPHGPTCIARRSASAPSAPSSAVRHRLVTEDVEDPPPCLPRSPPPLLQRRPRSLGGSCIPEL